MLTVYFVDDDSLVIEEMNTIIDWNDFGFEVVGGSTDPIAALEEINRIKPDLIFSDIEMDEMSGLKMVSLIEYNANVVFFSAYDRFEYAVDAIKLKALNYLKKPPKKSELIQIVNEVKEKEMTRFNQRVFRITSKSDINAENEKELESLFDNFRLLPQTDFRLVALYGESISKDFLSHLRDCSSFFYELYSDENLIIALAYEPDVERIKSVSDLGGANCAISALLHDYSNIYDGIRRIRVNSKMSFFNCYNTIVVIDEFENKANEIIEQLNACDNLADFQSATNGLYKRLSGNVLCGDIQRIYSTIVSGLFKFGLIGNAGEMLSASALDYYDNYEDMLNDLCSYFTSKEENGFAESVIQSIVEEMKNNVGEKLSLSTFAQKYNYNTAYLSIVFKRVMGVSFLNYLTELKMNYAKLLMINHPKLPLKNIANEVGYYDYYHFSKMFKKFVGCSPTDFRDDNK